MEAKNIIRFLLVVVLMGCLGMGPAIAADYPDKPITLIIPLGAGGSHDLNARVFTSVIPTYLDQPMVIKLMRSEPNRTATP